MRVLEEALSSMNTSQEHTILRLIIFQIFAVYYQSKNDSVNSLNFYPKALNESKAAGDTSLLVIPMPEPAIKKVSAHCIIPSNKASHSENQPLQVQVIFLVSQVIKNVSTSDIDQIFGNLLLTILYDCESTFNTTTTGWFNFHRYLVGTVRSLGRDHDALKLTVESISFHQNALQQSIQRDDNNGKSQEQHKEALAQNYLDLGRIQYRRGNYTEALSSFKLALDIRIALFGKEHPRTADSYHEIGDTQQSLSDYTAALESHKLALNIRIKLSGEEIERPLTATIQ